MGVTEIATFYRKCPSCLEQFGEWLSVTNSLLPYAVRMQGSVLALELLALLPGGHPSLLIPVEALYDADLLLLA